MKPVIFCVLLSFLFASTAYACPNGSTLRVRGQGMNSDLPPRFFEIGDSLTQYERADNQAPEFNLNCATSHFRGEGADRNARAVVVACTGPNGDSIAIPIKYTDVVGGQSLPVILRSRNGVLIQLTAGCFATPQ